MQDNYWIQAGWQTIEGFCELTGKRETITLPIEIANVKAISRGDALLAMRTAYPNNPDMCLCEIIGYEDASDLDGPLGDLANYDNPKYLN